MYSAIAIAVTTIVIMILGVLFFPKIKFGALEVGSYWFVALVGALAMLLFGEADIERVGRALIANTAINPLKILALFICMTLLSIYLDEAGFFRYIAAKALQHIHLGQKTLFLCLYLTVSVLTVFTSNDIIILSFTPFICYFAKNAKIDPKPYLAAEFVAANTWSMALIIGNPTNIYLATAFDIGFVSYLKVSLIPTLFAGCAALALMLLIFNRALKKPIEGHAEGVVIKDKLRLWVGILHLGVCTILLAIAQYIGVEMWLVSVCSAASLLVVEGIICLVRRSKPVELADCMKRVPFQLIPFVISMFVIILTLSDKGVTSLIADALGDKLPFLTYGVASFAASNVINNIPMSVLFASVLSSYSGAGLMQAVFATVIGSNIGAFLTPIGALAGIMFSSIAGDHGVRISYVDFLKIGVTVSIPTLFAALGGLYLSFLV